MSDDPTTKLPDEANYDTKPGITAVLERLSLLEERLTKKIDDAVSELRAEMQTGFRKLDRQMDALSGNITRLQADSRDLEGRVHMLEEKAS
jgi:ABC-type phosphate transport system auxiliary subunit